MRIKKTHMKPLQGFTLIELMVTIAIVAVISAIATPSFTEFIKNSRIDRESENLYSLLNVARQIALSNGRRGFVCRSTDTVTPTCDVATNNASWDNAKFAYTTSTGVSLTSPNADFTNQAFQTINSSLTTAQKAQVVVRVVELSAGGMQIVANNNDDVVAFSSEGALLNTAPFRIAICDDRANPDSFGRYIEINQAGRFKLKDTSATAGEIGCDAS